MHHIRRVVFPVAALVALVVTASAAPNPSDPFAYDRNRPLHFVEAPTRIDGVIAVTSISFDSPKGGRVTGKLFVPVATERGKTLAGVVMLHGAPGSTANIDPRATYIARKGAVVLAIDAAFARRDPESPIDFTLRDAAEQVQTVVDLRRAIDVLVSRKDVDPTRIGFVGGSYGAATGAVLAGIEDRVAAFALATGDAGFVAHATAADGSWLPPVRDLPPAQRDAWVAAMTPLSGATYFPRARGERVLLQNNRRDEAVLPHVAEAFHRLAPRGSDIRWYDAGHRLTPQHFVDQLEFLHRKIGTAGPTDDDREGPYAGR